MIESKISSSYYILIVLLGYIVLRYIYKPAITSTCKFSNRRKNVGICIILLICLFAVQDTDYFHYEAALSAMSQGAILHFEDIYYTIGDIVQYNYFLFRLVVWGSALCLFLITVKRLNVPIAAVLFFFVTMYLTKFSYGRASLAMAIGLFGFSFVVKPIGWKYMSYVIGVSIITVSLLFHKSAVFMIPIYLLSLFKMNKYTICISVILFPLGFYLISEYGIALLMGADDSDLIAESAQGYLMKDSHEKGVAVQILNVLSRTPYYIFLFVMVKNIIDKLYIAIPTYQRAIINVSIYVISFASLFLFDYSVNTTIMYYRFLYYSILPLSIVIPILFSFKNHCKALKFSCMMGFCAVVYEILYSFYNAYLSA